VIAALATQHFNVVSEYFQTSLMVTGFDRRAKIFEKLFSFVVQKDKCQI